MRRLAGQAARHTGRLVHALVQFAFAIALTSLGLLAVLTWRLSRGPMDMPWLASRLELAASTETPVHITLAGAALAWEGFSGVDRPLDIQVRDVVATDVHGTRLASIPDARVSLSTSALLLGRIEPRAIDVDGARLRVERAADGTVKLDIGGLLDSPNEPAPAADSPASIAATLAGLLRPPAEGSATAPPCRWRQLHRVRIRDAAVRVTDRQFGNTWTLAGLTADLIRAPDGGIAGEAAATMQLGGQNAALALTAKIDTATRRTELSATVGPIVPAKLAVQMHGAEALAPFDMPVALSGRVQLDPELVPQQIFAHADIGAGTLRLPNQTTVVLGGTVEAEGTTRRLAVRVADLGITPRPVGKRTVLNGQANLIRGADGTIAVTGSLGLDQVAFADLPELWPEGLGGPGSRPWIVQNITDGVAYDGHLDIAFTMPADFSDATVTHLAGGIDGDGLTVHWLRPVPPIEDGAAHLTFEGSDALAIAITGGRQGGLRINGGTVRFSGFNDKEQFADIEGDIAGPVPDLLALLSNPRIKLLERSPLPVADAAGQIAGRVTVAHLPLRDTLSMDDVNIRTTARLTGLHLAGVAAGHDLDAGTFAVDAGPEGLHAGGTATLAGLPVDLSLDMDFRAGPPAQVLQKVSLAGRADARDLAALGLDAGDLLAGRVGLNATLAVRRDRQAEATVNADLAQATLTVPPLGFAKPAGRPASLAATLRLDGDRLVAVAPLRLTGDGIQVESEVSFVAGKPNDVKLQRLALGATDLHGEVHVPQRPGEPWRISLAGASLDASSLFERRAQPSPPKPGPAYVADLRFDRVLLGKGRWIAGVAAHAESDGTVLRRVEANAHTVATGGGGGGGGGGAAFQVAIEPRAGARSLAVSTTDAGALLLALDLDDKMQGGRMTVSGSFDDRSPGHPLTGTAVIDNFRIRNAPVLAKLLQAMTLYGLVDAVSGPGLGFTRLEAPFRYADDTLELSDARAFSASLGMTAKGRLDLGQQTADVQGTIVPAYFFNSLLGNIPLIGRLLSPERGGGLFAATYAVRGPLDGPNVSINPLAALTPGVLRGVFGLLPGSSTPAPPGNSHGQAH